MLYLNWLRFQLRYGWREIIAAGGGTLSATYLHLTGKRTGWEDCPLSPHAHPNHFASGRSLALA